MICCSARSLGVFLFILSAPGEMSRMPSGYYDFPKLPILHALNFWNQKQFFKLLCESTGKVFWAFAPNTTVAEEEK